MTNGRQHGRHDIWNFVEDSQSGEERRFYPRPGADWRLRLTRNAVLAARRREIESVKGETTAVLRKDAKRGLQRLKATRLARRGCVCESCATSMPSPSLLHMHHVIPVSRGGETSEENCALLCPNCHTKAHWLDRKLSDAERPTCAEALLKRLVA